MHTRRGAIILASAIPLMAKTAFAQDPAGVSSLFKAALDNLQAPTRVQQSYANLSFYIQLLRARPEDLSVAMKTYQLVGQSIRSVDAKFDRSRAADALPSLVEAYQKSQTELWAYLAKIGIQPKSLAGLIIEEALISMMLFYAAATRVTNAFDLQWCIFPFCFKRPV